jgi:adenylate cyclase
MKWIEGRFAYKFRWVLGIIIAWAVIGALDAFNTNALVQSGDIQATKSYYFWRYLVVNTMAGAFAGFVSGTLLVYFLREKLRNRSFGASLAINTAVVVVINFIISILANELFISLRTGQATWSGAFPVPLIRSAYYLRTLIFWIVVVLLTLVTLNVNEKYGPGVFGKLLIGRYHRPREEQRIFMFVDIRSSTTIAERLGHIRFFNLLNDFYHDITNAIIYTSGEIYQYVGDEVVISWTMKNGAANANCIRCFYGMQEAIQKSSAYYQEKYGLVPEFKAGLHCGPVTLGEIGVIKKDIVFSGDVMNTTSRIQSVCNKFRVKILFSKYLLDVLNLPPHDFTPKRMGIIELKGKRQKVELYTFEENIEQLVPSIPSSSK